MNQTLQLWQIWLCLENNRLYRIIDLSDGEVVATTTIPNTGNTVDSFSWQSPELEFLEKFKFVKMGPQPKGV